MYPFDFKDIYKEGGKEVYEYFLLNAQLLNSS